MSANSVYTNDHVSMANAHREYFTHGSNKRMNPFSRPESSYATDLGYLGIIGGYPESKSPFAREACMFGVEPPYKQICRKDDERGPDANSPAEEGRNSKFTEPLQSDCYGKYGNQLNMISTAYRQLGYADHV